MNEGACEVSEDEKRPIGRPPREGSPAIPKKPRRTDLRIEATPEELAKAVLRGGVPPKPRFSSDQKDSRPFVCAWPRTYSPTP